MIIVSGSDHALVSPVVGLPKLPVVVDTQGRLRVTKAQRREILAALAHSGESVPQFARRTGLKYSTLARWVQRQRPKRTGRAPRLSVPWTGFRMSLRRIRRRLNRGIRFALASNRRIEAVEVLPNIILILPAVVHSRLPDSFVAHASS